MFIYQWDLTDIDNEGEYYEVIAIAENEEDAQEQVLIEIARYNWSPERVLTNAVFMQYEMCEQPPFVRPLQPIAFTFHSY